MAARRSVECVVVSTKKKTRTARVDARQVSIRGEAEYIAHRAAQRKGCIVSVGPLLFFATESGDAWVLDPDDGSARCLVTDGRPLSTGITETAESFAVEWTAQFRIDGEAMTFIERGRVRSVVGYPVRDIRRAIGRMRTMR
jgi:hypothetical protein